MSTSSDAKQLDRVFHALSDPTRRSIMEKLTHGPGTVTSLAEPFEMSLPAVSKHLRVLEGAGLIERKVEGRTHHCRLSLAPLMAAKDWLAHYTTFWTETLQSLDRYITKND